MPTKKMLYIASHTFYPPMNGGQLRIYYLLKGLSETYNITVIYPENNLKTLEQLKSHMPQLKIEAVRMATKALSLVEKIKFKLHFGLEKPLNQFNIGVYQSIKTTLKNMIFDVVFFEHLESLQAAGKITRTYYPNAKRVINLHNIDHELWLAQYETQPEKKELLNYSKKALKHEEKLHKKVDLALICSKSDQQTIETLNGGKLKTMIVPNGTFIPDKIPDIKAIPNSLLFVGALDFFPNIEGLKWFYYKVWPRLVEDIPDICFSIVGKGNRNNLSFIDHPQIKFIGEVDNVSHYYFNHQISIVPLLHGGGTRLKIPEAMAHNTPVVSTNKGAEGHPLENNKHLMLTDDPDKFAQAIITLLKKPKLYADIQNCARNWVGEHLDWREISRKLTESL